MKHSFHPTSNKFQQKFLYFFIVFLSILITIIYFIVMFGVEINMNVYYEAVSDKLFPLSNKHSLFCWVFTSSFHHNDRVPAVNRTWLPRCDYGVFFTDSDMNDSSINHIPIWEDLSKAYQNSHNKTMKAWPYVYREMSNKFDWYYKGEDDGYLIVENLRNFLSKYDPDTPHYFGAWFKVYVEKGYNAGAGYVFSRATLKLLVEAMEDNDDFCGSVDYEDLGVAFCLAKLNITPESTIDENGYQRFLAYSFQETYRGFAKLWYQENQTEGFEAFGPNLIQLHHLIPQEIFEIDTFLYKIRVHTFL